MVKDFLYFPFPTKCEIWRTFLSFRGQVFQRINMWIFLLFVCSIILWTAISFLYFVPSCFLLDSLWDKIRQLYSLHMAKKAEFGLWMNWGIKEYFQYVILLLIHLSIQTKPSWPGLLLPNYAFQHNTLLFPILSQRQMGGHWWWLCLHTFIGGCGQEGLTVWACPPSSGGGRLLSAEHNLPCPAGLHLSQYQIAERC